MRSFIALTILVTVAVIVRFWQLGIVPPSPDWDEAALGYNAYSVLKTGRDEYGTWFPLTLRSFDDYKPPLYMYLAVPSVALFGLETWAVRLPSAVAGVLAVIGTYFLVRDLWKRSAKHSAYTDALALTSSALLAISPWHIQFSRIAFEANIGVTLNIWAAWAFVRGVERRWLLSLSAFLFGLGLYAYHSERIFVPLLALLLSSVYRRALLEQRRSVVTAAIVGILTVVPLLPTFVHPTTVMRLKGTSSFADQTALLSRSARYLEQDRETGNPLGVVFDNRRIVWARTLLNGYLSHFSLRWLFMTGDNPRHHAPDMGLLYLVELPFLLWGMVSVGASGGALSKILFGWFLMAPIAASPTTEVPHAIRTIVFLPTFQIFTAIGLISFYALYKRWNNYRRHMVLLFAFLFPMNVLYYLHMYFAHQNHEFSKEWQYGYKEAVAYAREQGGRYRKVVVSTKLEQPHIFFLYFLRYDPAAYLAEGGTASGGFAEARNRFGKYEFRPIDWDAETKDGKTLYIGTPKEIPVANLLTITYLDGKEAIRIADR